MRHGRSRLRAGLDPESRRRHKKAALIQGMQGLLLRYGISRSLLYPVKIELSDVDTSAT